MSQEAVGNLTYPQAYQFAEMLRKIYKEQHRANETNHINQVLGQMKHGR